jgi:hypothetical protein
LPYVPGGQVGHLRLRPDSNSTRMAAGWPVTGRGPVGWFSPRRKSQPH